MWHNYINFPENFVNEMVWFGTFSSPERYHVFGQKTACIQNIRAKNLAIHILTSVGSGLVHE